MDDENEDDRLIIDFVRKNEVIYNIKHNDYRNTQLKTRLFMEFGKSINKDSNELMQRWKYIKDYYYRKKRGKAGTGSCGEAAARRNEWCSFLDNPTALKRTSINSVAEILSDSIDMDDTSNSTNTTPTLSSCSTPVYSPPSTPTPFSHSHPNNNKKRIDWALQQSNERKQIIENAIANQKAKTDIDLFFESLAKTVNKFPEYEAAQVKWELGEIVSKKQMKLLQQKNQSHHQTVSSIDNQPQGNIQNPSNHSQPGIQTHSSAQKFNTQPTSCEKTTFINSPPNTKTFMQQQDQTLHQPITSIYNLSKSSGQIHSHPSIQTHSSSQTFNTQPTSCEKTTFINSPPNTKTFMQQQDQTLHQPIKSIYNLSKSSGQIHSHPSIQTHSSSQTFYTQPTWNVKRSTNLPPTTKTSMQPIEKTTKPLQQAPHQQHSILPQNKIYCNQIRSSYTQPTETYRTDYDNNSTDCNYELVEYLNENEPL